MKKIYILLIASMVALAGIAQQKALKMSPKLAFTPTEAVKGDFPFKDNHKMKPLFPKMRNAQGPKRMDVITEQPEGELKLYERAGGAFYSFWGYLFGAYQDGTAMQIVFADDGKTVYMQNPISQFTQDTWVKAELSDDGKTITLPMGQCLYFSDAYGYGYMMGVIKMGLDEEGALNYSYEQDVTEVTYTLGDDGTITLNNTYGDFNTYECYGPGLVWTDDLTWTGYMDFNSVYTPFTDTLVEVPEGTQFEDWSMTWVEEAGRSGKMVQGAIVGNDVYVKGWSDMCPEGVVKGTLADGVVTFPSQQYIGIGSGAFMRMYGLTTDGSYYYTLDELSFDYEEATTTLTSREIMATVAGTSIYEAFQEPIFNKYEDHAGTPSDPQVLSFSDSESAGGYTYGNFFIPVTDTDGNFMNPDDIYYRIYFDDDELFTFSPDEYPYVTEAMNELNYNYTDNYDIRAAAATIYFYETGFQRVGIQTIFRGGGEEHFSNIVYYDLTSGEDIGDTKQIYSEYYGDESDLSNVGTQKAEAYDVAMFVEDASLEGKAVKGIRFRAADCNATSYAGWLSYALGTETRDDMKRASADITWKDVEEVEPGVVEVIFDEPFVIGKDGFYAGYSLIVPELVNEADQYPLVLCDGDNMFLHTSRSYRTWKEFSYNTTIELLLAGDNVYENASVIIPHDDYYVKAGEELNLNMKVVNHGTNDLANVNYIAEINGMEDPVLITLDEPISGAYYGYYQDINITLPAIDKAGDYSLYINNNKANGAVNNDPCAIQYATVHVLDFVPTKRPLMEEYTGTWCGWCTRGLIAMREIAKKYGDEVVAVAYHNSDPMEIMSSSSYPSKVSGFPGAWVDRKYNVDPFYGLGSESFGITEVLDYQKEQIAECALSLNTAWDDSKSTISATATACFIGNYDEDNYRIAYMLVEDDMYGDEGTEWDQNNYYPSYASYYGSDPYLSEICNMDATITGWHFDDVLVASTGIVDGSLPADIKAGEYYSNVYTFTPDNLVNTSGEALVQNKDKLSVVAIVVNTATGEVVNAIKAMVGESASVTELNSADKQIESTRYYDLQGRQVNEPTNGFYIKQIRFTDGTTISVKVLK